MPDGYELDWRGDEVKQIVLEHGAEIIAEFGLTVEGESKKELSKGHGVETGTARRSIHTALPGYDWGGDDVEPSNSSPERGDAQVVPDINGSKLTIEVGSGLKYALPLHQGHHNFSGYHFLTNGLNKAKENLASIIARHKVQK